MQSERGEIPAGRYSPERSQKSKRLLRQRLNTLRVGDSSRDSLLRRLDGYVVGRIGRNKMREDYCMTEIISNEELTCMIKEAIELFEIRERLRGAYTFFPEGITVTFYQGSFAETIITRS